MFESKPLYVCAFWVLVLAACGAGPGASNTVASGTLVAGSGEPNALIAVTVTCFDAANMPVAAVAVNVNSANLADTFTASQGATDANGVFTTFLQSTVAGVRTVTAAFAGQTRQTSITINPGPVSAAATALSVRPKFLTTDTKLRVQFQARDAFQNAVPNAAVSFATSNSVGGTFQPASAVTDSNGLAATVYASTTVGAQTLSASCASLIFDANLTVLPGAVSAVTSTFVADPTTFTAGGNSNFTVYLADAHNNPLEGNLPYFLIANPSTSSIVSTSGPADATGHVYAVFQSSAAGTQNVSMLLGPMALNAALTVIPGAPSTTASTLTGPISAQVGASVSFSVLVADAFGNPLGNELVTFASSDASGVFTPGSLTTADDGTGQLSYVSTTAGTATLIANVGGANANTTFTLLPGNPNSQTSSLVASPSQAPADGTGNVTLTVSFVDDFGNVYSDAPVTWSLTGTDGTLRPAGTLTDNHGQATATLTSLFSETKTVTAQSGGTSVSTTVVFTTVPSEAYSTLTFGTGVLADGQATVSLTLTALDSSKSPIPKENVSIVDAQFGILAQPSGPTGPDGTFSTTLQSNFAGSHTVTAKFAGIQKSASSSFQNPPVCLGAVMLPGAPAFQTGAGGFPELAAHDLNNDGYADVVALGTDATLSVYMGTPIAGSLSGLKQELAGVDFAVADFDNSGTLDIAVLNNTIDAYSGEGDGTFTFVTTHQTGSNYLTTADVNGDGFADIIDLDTANAALGTLINQANSQSPLSFDAEITVTTDGHPLLATAAYLDADAYEDVIVLSSDTQGAQIFLGSRTGALTAAGSALAINDSTYSVVSAVAVDFNGDAVVDVALNARAAAGGSKIIVYLGDNAGGFALGRSFTLPDAAALSPGDFNNDGVMDLAFTGLNATGVMAGDGHGAFTKLGAWGNLVGAGIALASADFNGDGTLDLAASGLTSQDLVVGLGTGDGGFAPLGHNQYQVDVEQTPAVVVVADLNSDGKNDVVAGALNSADVAVLLGNGDGSLRAPATYAGASADGTDALAVVDLNHDGALDVISSTHTGSALALSVALNTGDGKLGTPSAPFGTTNSTAGAALHTADLNHDGNQDIVWVSTNASVLFGKGDGTFEAQVDYTAFSDGRGAKIGLSLADFNHDGNLDMVTVNPTAAGFTISLGDANGVFYPTALTQYQVNYFATDVSAQDLDHDGSVDLVFSGRAVATITKPQGVWSSLHVYNSNVSATQTPAVVADVNGDNVLDVVVSFLNAADNSSVNSLFLYQGVGDGTLASPVLYPAGNAVAGAAAGDLNNDGKPDMVVAAAGTPSVNTLLNNGCIATRADSGAGAFSHTLSTLKSYSYGLTVADFNHDGLNDVAYAGYQQLMVQLGSGGSAAAPQRSPATYTLPVGMVAGDLTQDGNADVVACDVGANALVVSTGNGDGTFQPSIEYPTTGTPQQAVIVDVNHDGQLDVLVASSGDDTLEVFLGNGNTLLPGKSFGAAAGSDSRISDLAVTDFNHDGHVDVALATANYPAVSVLLGNGDGTYQNVVTYDSNYASFGVRAADFNHDGHPDIVAVENGRVVMLVGHGDGSFAGPAVYPGLSALGLAVADFNIDGTPDVAIVASTTSSGIGVLFGKPDGTLMPMVQYATGGGAEMVSTADMDNDGKPEILVPAPVQGALYYLHNSGT